MLSEERYNFILELLEKEEILKLSDIVEHMNSSESTVRRDLVYLEKNNLLERIHGGAKKITRKSEELSYNEKTSKNIHDKDLIGQKASELVKENDAIFIDAGTTTYNMIKYLKGKNIFVVTNGLNHIEELVKYNINCYIIGGKIKLSTKAIVGSDAINCLSKFVFDKAFIGTNGIDERFGFTTPDSEEAEFKRKATKISKEVYILADHSKFYNSSLVKFCELEDAKIITDDKVDLKNFESLKNVKS